MKKKLMARTSICRTGVSVVIILILLSSFSLVFNAGVVEASDSTVNTYVNPRMRVRVR